MDNLNFFPFTIKKYQVRLYKEIYSRIGEGKAIVFEAPMGIGKTVLALSSALAYSQDNQLKLLYISRTHLLSEKVMHIIKKIKSKANIDINIVNIRGKRNLCPIFPGSDVAALLCSALRFFRTCNYYHKAIFDYNDGLKIIKRVTGNIHYNEIIERLINAGICPYYLLRHVVSDADVMIGTYFYVFGGSPMIDPLSMLNINPKNYILIADEAHNIPEYVFDSYTNSVDISKLSDITHIPSLSDETYNLINRILIKLKEFSDGKRRILSLDKIYDVLDINECLLLYKLLRGWIPKRIMYEYQKKLGEKEIQHIVSLYNFLGLILSNSENYKIAVNDGKLVLYPFGLYKFIATQLKQFYSYILISATFPSASFLDKIFGLKISRDYERIEFLSIPHIKKIKVLVVPGITTLYKYRSVTLYEEYVRLLKEIHKKHRKKVIAFAASREVVEGIKSVSKEDICIGEEFTDFRDNDANILLFSQRGRWREGIDIKGNILVIIGVSIPTPDLLNQLKIHTIYHNTGSTRDSYIISGIIAAIQSIGRILREEKDEVYIYLLENRFLNKKYIDYFPNWLKKHVSIVKPNEI